MGKKMETYKLEIKLIEVRVIEVKAKSEEEAIKKVITPMPLKKLEKIVGEVPEATTGWDYIRTIE